MNATFEFDYYSLPQTFKAMTFSYLPPDVEQGIIRWNNISRDIFSAGAFIQPKIDNLIVSRSDVTWEGGPVFGNPDGDPESEIVLKNSQGDIQTYVFELCKKANGYFYHITGLNKNFTIWTQYINLCTVVGVWFMIILYCHYKIRVHYNMINRTMAFKVGACHIARRPARVLESSP